MSPAGLNTTCRALLALIMLVVGHWITGQGPAHAEGPRGETVDVHLFWTATCPHCTKARSFVESLARRQEWVRVSSRELGDDERNEAAYEAVAKHFSIDPPVVPVIFVGNDVIVGYDEDSTTGAELERMVERCRRVPCPDVAGRLIAAAGSSEAGPAGPETEVRRTSIPRSISVPIIGEVETRSLSLPALTILLGAIDGFNPCAMWVLVFLIGLLLGLNDPVRMWSYGAAFILTSAAVYFAFMAAWLNVFLFLGSLAWIRAAVGVVAIIGAAYYLREFFINPEGACVVTSPGERATTMGRLRTAVADRSFLMAIVAISVLAVGVNMIELVCSAGIPAVYTQVLALSDLSPAAYYAYIGLYILVFMLDDAIVFVTAMVTLQATGLVSAYSRYSHLVGSVVLGAVGTLLLVKPEWLSFAG